jgi:hypothetical protein
MYLFIYLFNLEVCTYSRVRVMTGLRCGNVRSLTHVLYRHLSARKLAKSSDQGRQCKVICRVIMRSLTACVMTHVVSRRFLNAVVSLRYLTSPGDICRGHNVTRTGFFFPSTSVFPLSVWIHQCSIHSFIHSFTYSSPTLRNIIIVKCQSRKTHSDQHIVEQDWRQTVGSHRQTSG